MSASLVADDVVGDMAGTGWRRSKSSGERLVGEEEGGIAEDAHTVVVTADGKLSSRL